MRRSTVEMLPGVELIQADVYDADGLATQFADADAVVSMAGILNESGRGGKGFHKVHVELVETIIKACRKAGVPAPSCSCTLFIHKLVYTMCT